jgi:hypothetical protein
MCMCLFRCQPFFDATCELALEAQEGLHSCGRPRGVLHSWRNIHKWHGQRINSLGKAWRLPSCIAQLAALQQHMPLDLVTNQKTSKHRSTLMSILLEGTISDQPNSFSHPAALGKKKSWASHGLLEKVEQISSSFCLLTWSQVCASESHIASATTSWAALNASCRWFMSFMSPKPSGAECYSGFSTGASCLLRSKQSSSMFKLDDLNRKKTHRSSSLASFTVNIGVRVHTSAQQLLKMTTSRQNKFHLVVGFLLRCLPPDIHQRMSALHGLLTNQICSNDIPITSWLVRYQSPSWAHVLSGPT